MVRQHQHAAAITPATQLRPFRLGAELCLIETAAHTGVAELLKERRNVVTGSRHVHHAVGAVVWQQDAAGRQNDVIGACVQLNVVGLVGEHGGRACGIWKMQF